MGSGGGDNGGGGGGSASDGDDNEEDEDDGYDSEYEEEKDSMILKLKTEAGQLENELKAIRRKIEVERAKIPGGPAACVMPETLPVMVTAETQTDMFEVDKPTRPPPQPQSEPPPLPQSEPPPLPQSEPPPLTPQLLESIQVNRKNYYYFCFLKLFFCLIIEICKDKNCFQRSTRVC